MAIGLRIDVDTYRGTRDGVPRLLEILRARSILATWYLTLGPDNMGRHLFRMLRPAFALKMLRSGAPSLYGWDILLRGTLWPGPVICDRLARSLKAIDAAGHEVGLHAWDHHRWQSGIDSLSDEALEREIERAREAFVRIFGREPETAAAPGWRCTERVLALRASRAFRYRSDCRGAAGAFRPRVAGNAIAQPQVPVDLPTLDEACLDAGGGGVGARFNDSLLARLADGAPHVLTVHAESEGGVHSALFESFLNRAIAAGHRFVPLSDWLAANPAASERSIAKGQVPGREGWLCVVAGDG